MPFVEATIDVAAPARDVYELAKDQERFPDFMPDVELVTVVDRVRMPFVEATIDVAAPARDVYELAKDQERFPEFMPDVELVTVVDRYDDRVVSRWKTLVEEAPIEWIEEDVFDDVGLRVDYRLLEGDLDKFEGSWTFEERDGVTHVRLGVEYDFGVPTLAELIGPTLHKKVQENSAMMLAALKREAEAARRP